DEYHAADRERTERHANASRCARTAQELPHAIPPAGEEDAQHAERPEHETDPATEIRQPAGCYAEAYIARALEPDGSIVQRPERLRPPRPRDHEQRDETAQDDPSFSGRCSGLLHQPIFQTNDSSFQFAK